MSRPGDDESVAVRPEHADLKLYQSPGQSAGGLIEPDVAALAVAAAGATPAPTWWV